MAKRLSFLLLLFGLVSGVGAAQWLWPASGRLPVGRLRAGLKTLYIVPVQPVTNDAVRALVEAIGPWLPLNVEPVPNWTLDERHTLSWDGDLYDATRLVERLAEITPPDAHVLGITDQPMHDEVYWRLYGKSRLGGRTALVSTALLWVDGREGDTTHPLFRGRINRVGVHEFGHTLGYLHCENPRCVMKESSNLATLDRKRPTLCAGCLR
jgi:predicted Zn-dependent protease